MSTMCATWNSSSLEPSSLRFLLDVIVVCGGVVVGGVGGVLVVLVHM
jgi:hypothetical protein